MGSVGFTHSTDNKFTFLLTTVNKQTQFASIHTIENHNVFDIDI